MATVGGRQLFRCKKIYNVRGFERRLFTKNNVNQLDLFLKSNKRLYSIKSFVNDSKTRNRMATFTFVLTYGMSIGTLFSNMPTSLDDDDDETNSRLLAAVKRNESFDHVKHFLHNGAGVNGRHPLGWTALHQAVVNGNIDVVKQLLKAGADPNLQDNFSHYNQVDQFRLTEEKTHTMLNLNFSGVQLIQKKYKRQIQVQSRKEEFSDRANVQTNCLGCTALHYAVLCGNMDIINALLQAGADPTITNAIGRTPEMCAFTDDIKRQFKESADKYINERLRLADEESRKFPLELRFKEHIIGQEGAINIVASAIKRKENGWYDEDHPLVFLFLGSSGIGKTELTKQIASYLHKDKDLEKGFIRLDMSEYHEKHGVIKLIGAPPGYVGHEQGGQLTNMLHANPKAVVLFDKVDKAHPDVRTIMLQLFDEGRLTDGYGRTIKCKDATFIMTSNLAADKIGEHGFKLRREAELVGKQKRDTIDKLGSHENITVSRQFKDDVVRPILKQHLRDEFLGRIDEFVYFLPFSRLELGQLVLKELNFWSKRASAINGMSLSWDDEVVDALTAVYDRENGARSLKKEVKDRVTSQLAMAHERQMIEKCCIIKLTVAENNQAANQSSDNTGDNKDVTIPIKLQVLQK